MLKPQRGDRIVEKNLCLRPKPQRGDTRGVGVASVFGGAGGAVKGYSTCCFFRKLNTNNTHAGTERNKPAMSRALPSVPWLKIFCMLPMTIITEARRIP